MNRNAGEKPFLPAPTYHNWRASLFFYFPETRLRGFTPLTETLIRFFPNVALEIPTLAAGNAITVDYVEDDQGPLDIVQSGAGMRSFLAIIQVLLQSTASVILLDEPDAHLHASQQAAILSLLTEATEQGRQVILATHSPEIISRVPLECVRCIKQGAKRAEGGTSVADMLDRLGVTPDLYIALSQGPDVIVYVEGETDKRVIEALIAWCRRHPLTSGTLPTTMVVHHKYGRFDEDELRAIVRLTEALPKRPRIVGIRDLDFFYDSLQRAQTTLIEDDRWALLTLGCKEMENLFCDADLLFDVYDRQIPREELRRILEEESLNQELIDQWDWQVKPKIRKSYPATDDDSTRERKANAEFSSWKESPDERIRLVAGKQLARIVRGRIGRDHRMTRLEERIFDHMTTLTPAWWKVARAIFPVGVSLPKA